MLTLYFQVPEKLLLSSCHLIVSITSTVRPVFLVTLPAVQNIFNLITTENQNHRLPPEVNAFYFLFSYIGLFCFYYFTFINYFTLNMTLTKHTFKVSCFQHVFRLKVLCLFVLQAQMLVCRALSNMLLLPWPNLPESEQEWQTRSSNHVSLLTALTREYCVLRRTVNITPRQPALDNSQCFFLFHI